MKSRVVISCALFLAGLAMYFSTLCPGMFVGDSGEIATAGWYLGIPHSTGFPTYVNASRIAGFLPFGNIIYRTNLYSAVLGAIDVFLLYLILTQLEIHAVPSIIAALVFMVIPNFWSQSIITRVYTLSHFLLFTTLFMMIRAVKKRDIRYLYAGCVLFGLALNSHGGIISAAPAVVFFTAVYLAQNRGFIRKHVTSCILWGLLGFTVILFIPLRGDIVPFPTWHHLSSFNQFIDYIAHREYGFKMLGRSSGEIFIYLNMVVFRFAREWSLPFLIIAAIHLLIIPLRRPVTGVGLLLLAAGNITQMCLYGSQEDILIAKRFFIPTHFVLACSLAILLNSLHSIFREKNLAYISILFLLIPVSLFFRNHEGINLRTCYLPGEYSAFALDQCSRDSVLFHLGDNISFPVWYLQNIEKKRPDIVDVTVSIADKGSYATRLRTRLLNHIHGPPFPAVEHRQAGSLIPLIYDSYDPVYSTYSDGLPVPEGRHMSQNGLLTVISRNHDAGTRQSFAVYPWHIPEGGWKSYLRHDDIELRQLAQNVIDAYTIMMKEGLDKGNSAMVTRAKQELISLLGESP